MAILKTLVQIHLIYSKVPIDTLSTRILILKTRKFKNYQNSNYLMLKALKYFQYIN